MSFIGRPESLIWFRRGSLVLDPEPVVVRDLLEGLGLLARRRRSDGLGLHSRTLEVADVLAAVAASVPTAARGRDSSAAAGFRAQSALSDPLTVKQVAAVLGCNVRNARDLCAREVFASATKATGRWLVERAEVEARRDQQAAA